MKNFVQDGNVLDLTLASDVASGEGRVTGSIFGVAQKAGKTGDKVPFKTDGVYDFPYAINAAISEGDVAYWDAAAKKSTKTSTSNTKIGVFTEARSANAEKARVKLIASI